MNARDVAAPADEVLLFAGLDDIPHFSPDRDRDPVPPAVVALGDQLAAAESVVARTRRALDTTGVPLLP